MTPKQEAALRLALETFERMGHKDSIFAGEFNGEITAIREALAEPKEKYQYGTPLLDAMTGKTEQPAHVAAVNTSPERVDKTAKNVHEQPAQVPVAWIEHGSNEVPSIVVWERGDSGSYTPLYTSPPASKPWVDLTDDEIDDIYQGAGKNDLKRAREVLAAFKEKNT